MYTEKKHVENLLEMLSEEDPCSCCPYPKILLIKRNNNVCNMCREFVDIKAKSYKCPCHVLGKEEAIKRTWLKLEKENYI